jgi:hypothetical protein
MAMYLDLELERITMSQRHEPSADDLMRGAGLVGSQ